MFRREPDWWKILDELRDDNDEMMEEIIDEEMSDVETEELCPEPDDLCLESESAEDNGVTYIDSGHGGLFGSPDFTDPGNNGTIYKHYYGELVDFTEDESGKMTGMLLCKGKLIGFSVDSDTTVDKGGYTEELQRHVIIAERYRKRLAKAICTDSFYHLFDSISSIRRKSNAMRGFLALSVPQREAIISQLNADKPRECGERKDGRIKETGLMRLRYDMCKHTYSIEQQMEIEELLNTKVLSNKLRSRLEYILNISPVYPDRKTPSYKEIIAILDKYIYKKDKLKKKIAEQIVSGKYSSSRSLKLLFVGSPGTGKTLLAKAIAEIYGIPYATIDMGTVASAIDIKGLDASYDSADAGEFIKKFYQTGTSEMVLVLDELDKMGNDTKNGPAAGAMLDVLSDENKCYDKFLETFVKTDNTVFIATANSVKNIPSPLLNRFEVIYIDDYSDEDKYNIAQEYIIPQLEKDFGLENGEIVFTNEAVKAIIKYYCCDEGARLLKDKLNSIIKNLISRREEEGLETISVDAAMVREILEEYVSDSDIKLIYHRNKDRLSTAHRQELKRIFKAIENDEVDKNEKDIWLKRARLLLDLIPPAQPLAKIDFDSFYESVNGTHFGLTGIKDRIAKSLHVRMVQGKSFSSIRFLLGGGAGVGKSSICKSIADSIGVPFVKISLNGVSDERIIKGFPPTYRGAVEGSIVAGLARAKTVRALVLLDEIDKLGSKEGVSASNALIDLLDNSGEFTDDFLKVPIDLSEVIFIASANDLSKVNPLLLDRFEVIEVDGYSKAEKKTILNDYIIPATNREYERVNASFAVSPDAADLLVEDYCTSFGVRDLEKTVKKLVSDKLAENAHNIENQRFLIDASDVTKSLGAKPIPRGNLLTKNVPGFSKALAVTGGNSGMAFSIESAVIPGDTSLSITGLPKESAVDSVKLAKTYIRLNHLDSAADFGLHLHFGEGAVVKDGPSAGVAILISILSAVLKTPVSGNLAYTGEIDLFGNVFAIGGTKEKISAAQESGCSKVFIPYDNYMQLSEEELDSFSIEIMPVKHISEVIALAFPDHAEKVNAKRLIA